MIINENEYRFRFNLNKIFNNLFNNNVKLKSIVVSICQAKKAKLNRYCHLDEVCISIYNVTLCFELINICSERQSNVRFMVTMAF